MPKSEDDSEVETREILQITVELLDIQKAHKCHAITFFAIVKIGDAKIRR